MSKIFICNSRCHNAKCKRCECWCEGRYHGLGTEKARKLFLEDHANHPNFPTNIKFIPGRSPELEAGFNESKMPTGK